jgi:hypothetical protein
VASTVTDTAAACRIDRNRICAPMQPFWTARGVADERLPGKQSARKAALTLRKHDTLAAQDSTMKVNVGTRRLVLRR